MSDTIRRLLPIYTSRGDVDAFLVYPYIYNRIGEWIGFVNPEREVYSVMGVYVGMFTKDSRIVGQRATNTLRPPLNPPPPPGKIYPPATVPLAPMMSDLPPGRIDILQEEPERLHTVDSGEFRPDLD